MASTSVWGDDEPFDDNGSNYDVGSMSSMIGTSTILSIFLKIQHSMDGVKSRVAFLEEEHKKCWMGSCSEIVPQPAVLDRYSVLELDSDVPASMPDLVWQKAAHEREGREKNELLEAEAERLQSRLNKQEELNNELMTKVARLEQALEDGEFVGRAGASQSTEGENADGKVPVYLAQGKSSPSLSADPSLWF